MLIGVIYKNAKVAPCSEEQARALVESGWACFIRKDAIKLRVSPFSVLWEPVRGFRPGWPLPSSSRFIVHTDVIHKVRDLIQRFHCSNKRVRSYIEDMTVNNGRLVRFDGDGSMIYSVCNGLVFRVRPNTGTVVDVSSAA